MSRLIRCIEGHIFPADRGPLCPVCGASTSFQETTAAATAASAADATAARQNQPMRRSGAVAGIGAAAGLVVAGTAAFLLWPMPVLTPIVAADKDAQSKKAQSSTDATSSKTQPDEKPGESSKKSAEVKSAEPPGPKKEELKTKSADTSAAPKTETKGADTLRDVAGLIPSIAPRGFTTDIKVRLGQTATDVKSAYAIVLDPLPYNSSTGTIMSYLQSHGMVFYFSITGRLESIRVDEPFTGHVLGIRMGDPLTRIKQSLGEPAYTSDYGRTIASIYQALHWPNRVRFHTRKNDGKVDTIWLE